MSTRRYAKEFLGGAAALVAVLVIIAWFVGARELAAVFVVGYTAVVSTALGTLAIALIAHLTTATWFRPFRARADSVVASLPALAAIGLILPIALPTLYPWVGSSAPAHAYLNAPFFVARYLAYWIAWIATGESLLAARRAHRRGNVASADRRFRRTACIGLIVLALTMTFAAFDWMMSLTPDWQSSIYGLYWFAGGALAALALLAVLSRRGESSLAWSAPSVSEIHSLGKLMMTFVLFWLYTGFAQYVVIWSGDIPKEVTWYVPRTHDGWGYLAGALVFGTFVIPFLLLLLEAVKRSRAALAAIGGALLVLHYLDAFWVVLPGLLPVRWWTVVAGLAVLAAICGATSAFVIAVRRVIPAQSLPSISVVESPG